MERQMTDLEMKMQEIACKNWFQFEALFKEDHMLAAKICLLRGRDLTYGQIGKKLDISEAKVRWWCGECDTKPG